MSALETLAGMPFPRQIAEIDAHVARRGSPEALLETLAAFPDHEPLAHAVRALAGAERLDSGGLRRLLTALPDTGVQRVLRGLDRAALGEAALGAIAGAVAEAIGDLGVERIAAVCLIDRWLKNADPARHATLREAALREVADGLDRGKPGEIADSALLHVPGRRFGALGERARGAGCAQGWEERVGAFGRRVLETLRDVPRSLSQANAEDILARRVYTSPGHFLVELLQNAEDAGASAFEAWAGADEVSVWHDGAPFDCKDVVGVLSIGQTTKSREQIGFFGVGFKSVYEVCERPQVYSPLFDFEIADISIPRPLAGRPATAHPDGGTLIVLPRRHPLRPEHAPERLYERMVALPPETLLTLTHLARIRVGHGERQHSVIRRADPAAGCVVLEVSEAGEQRRYRVASRRFVWPGARRELSRAAATTVLVAVRLDPDGAPVPLPEDAPTLYSHLPTGERSGLRFLVHAGFEVPVDRERLDLSAPWNRWALTCAAELVVELAARVAAEGNDADLAGLLDVLPLARELHHEAYRAMLEPLRSGVADLALLLGAAGGRLRPREARVVPEPALARALAEAPLDGDRRRACGPLASRRAEVARALGALDFGPEDLLALLAATLAGRADGEPWPTRWLAEGHGVLLDALGRAAEALPAATLQALPLLPDARGCLYRATALRRTTPALRALYGEARPFLAPGIDDAPTPHQALLLGALGVKRHGDAELIADLEDAAMASSLLEVSGPLRLHAHLATLGTDLTAGVGELPLFPDTAGTLRALVGGSERAWLLPEGPLGALVAALPVDRCVPRVAPELLALRPYLARLGGRTLDLAALLGELAAGRIRFASAEILALHRVLDALSVDLPPRQCRSLAEAPIFPTLPAGSGALRPLLGEGAALIPASAAVEALAPAAPWLDPAVRGLGHLHRLPVRAVGTPEVVRALASGAGSALLDPRRVEDLRRAYRYLLAHAHELSAGEATALAAAPIWLDATGAPRALSALRRPAAEADLASLFAALDAGAVAEAGPPPSALSVLDALGLGGALPSADHAALVALLGKGEGAELAAGPLRATLVAALGLAAARLPAALLAPLRAARLFAAEEGQRLPPGDWRLPPAEAAYRAGGKLRAALALGSRPLMSEADEADLGSVLEALQLEPATGLDLVVALEEDPALARPEARRAARTALVAAREDLAGLGSRLSALPLWRGRDGQWRPAEALVRGSQLRAALGEDWSALVGDAVGDDVLAAEDEADAAALSGLAAFRTPVDLVVAALRAHARPDRPLAEQPPLLADRERLLRLLALLGPHLGADAMRALPLQLDVEGRLVARRLWSLEAQALGLTRGLALRSQLADAAWAEGARAIDPDLAPPLGPQRLLAALSAAAAPARIPSEVEALATPDARAALWAWLGREASAIAEDAQALGTLGNARLIPTADGGLRAPRELLLADGGLALPEWLGLAGWRPADEVPEGLRAWLRAVFELEGEQRKRQTEILVEAHRRVASEVLPDRAERSAAILAVLARLWPSSDDAAEQNVFRWMVSNHQLQRLKIETDGGGPEQVARLLVPAADDRELLPRFLIAPEAVAHACYSAPAVRELLVRLGARPALGADRLTELLDAGRGLREGPEAALALARYVASLAPVELEGVALARLARWRWIPDGAGERRAPAELYWPDPDVAALVGDRRERFPHPELTLTVPEALCARLPFRRLADVTFEDVLAQVDRDGGASAAALGWLERALAAGRLDERAVREAFDAALRLTDDDGRSRRARELCRSDPRAWVGSWVGRWSAAADLPHLAAALKVPEEVGAEAIAAWMCHLRDALGQLGAAGLLDADPELAERLPRCLARLAELAAPPFAGALVVAEAPGGGLTVAPVADPGLALAEPAWLATAAAASRVPVAAPVLFEEARGACTRWLRSAGMVDLGALFDRDRLPAVLPQDVTPAHAEAARALSAALARAGERAALRPWWPERIQVRVVERLTLTGRLAGVPVAAEAPAAWDARRGVLAMTVEHVDDRAVAARALVEVVEATRDRPEEWTEAVVRAMAGEEPAAPGAPAPRAPERAPGGGRGLAAGAATPGRGEGAVGPRETPHSTPLLGLARRPAGGARASLATGGSRGGGGPGRPVSRPRPLVPRAGEPGPQLQQEADLASRRAAPERGFATSPRSLPWPYTYAPILLGARLDPPTQHWLPLRSEPATWRAGGAPGPAAVAVAGHWPAGESVFPLPLYARLLSVEGQGLSIARARDGRALLAARAAVPFTASLALDAAPAFEGRTEPAPDVPELLAPTVPDEELPREVLDFADALGAEERSPLDAALAVRDFVRRRYRYNPSYLEDSAVGAWLLRATRGRANVHVAALHAARDGQHLGAGVCYELNALACELLRRVGVPAAVASGWTWSDGQVADPDHFWAMALLPSDLGPRWAPIDTVATHDGRPLRAWKRPQAPWRVAPGPRAPLPRPPSWASTDPRRRERAAETPEANPSPPARPAAPHGPSRAVPSAGGQRDRAPRQSPRRRTAPAARPPVGPLIRVIRHLSTVSGTPIDGDGLLRRCGEVLDDPEAARRVLEELGVAEAESPEGGDGEP